MKKEFSTSVSFDKTTRIGWVGTGIMGRWMCQHLIDAGFTNCTVYNRTISKTKPLVEKGAIIASSPFEVGQRSDIVFTMLGYPKDVQEVILGTPQQRGIVDSLRPGGIIVDMTTSEPSLAREIFQVAKQKKISSVDAPVSGGDVGAREARLSIMVGGEKEVVEQVRPLFQIMGTLRYMGPAGSGQHTKMVNQILISTMMIGVTEGLLYAHKAGLNLSDVIAAVGAGAAGSWSINNYGPRIAKRDFNPGFFVEHFVKDMEIALKEAEKMNLKLPGLDLALRLYKELKAQGHAKKGTHALMLALEKMNKIENEDKNI